MTTRPLNILICSNNETTMHQMARVLTDEGVTVQTTKHLIDHLCFSPQEWDFLLIDLDELNGFLRSLLPVVFRTFPHLPRIGISTASVTEMNGAAWSYYDLELDAYLSEVPQPEELIVLFPQVVDKYLCDDDTLHDLAASSLHFEPQRLESIELGIN